MPQLRLLPLLALPLLCWNLPACAQQHFPSNDELRTLRTIASPQLSPDGQHAVAVVTDSTADGGRTHLWLLSTTGQSPRQLTFTRPESQGERQPEYLPDGSAILFLARRDGKASLFRLPLAGGEPSPVKLERAPTAGESAAPVNVDSFALSPDGHTIAVTATDPEPAERTRDRKEKKDVVWVEHDDLLRRVYLVDIATNATHEVPTLTDPDGVTWSPDSRQLLVLTHTHIADLGPSAVATLVDAAAPSTQHRLNGIPESTDRAAFLHHGEALVLAARCQRDSPSGCSDLYTFTPSTGALRNLTAAIEDSTLIPEPLRVTSDDQSILVGYAHGMSEGIATISLATGKLTPLDFGLPVVTGLRESSSSAYVYIGGSSTSPASVYLTGALGKPGRRLVQPELAPISWLTVAPRHLSWRRAGFTVEGLLYLPPQAASAKVPLVVNVHGGPRGQFTDSFVPLNSLLLGQGYAVLLTNPRGSTGYGVRFEAANKDDMGNGDYLDIMAGVDEVLRTQPIDPDKLALIGYSYGGEMAGFVEGKSTRFKAIISGAPVTDQFSEYGTESESWYDRWYTGQPWRHFESAWRQSPLAYAQHARTPFLLLQGQSDTTDPEGQSQEYYRALRQEGVPVQLLFFPREDHGALGANFAGLPSTEPWAGVICRQHMLDFLRDGFAGVVTPNKP